MVTPDGIKAGLTAEFTQEFHRRKTLDGRTALYGGPEDRAPVARSVVQALNLIVNNINLIP